MGADPSSQTGSQDSGDDPSVTDVAGPSITRDRTPELERGTVLGARYQVEAVIGRGGSGVVLRAFDRTAQAVVAVKVLKPELVHDQRWSKRFSRELRLGRPIRHPNVCRIFDIGEGDGHRFLTMELATGGTLRDLIKKGEPLRPLAERLADAEAAIAGLAAIHEAGIVHRDVKPDNMLRMGDGRLALSDFGLATDLPTEAGVTVMVGTPHYMAPEVRAGEPATTRSDVWSLGVVLFEIFFGKRPERRSSKSSEGMSKPPAPLTATPIERAMLALAERCLAENPTERPADAREVLRLFERAKTAPSTFLRPKQFALSLILALIVGVGVVVAVKGVRRLDATATPAPSGGAALLQPSGQPVDWEKSAVIADLPGPVYCFSSIGDRTVRVIWGTPRRAEDIDVLSGERRPASLLPETYRLGCPQLSPRGGRLLFAALSSEGTSEIRVADSSTGAHSVPVTAGTEPVWLKNEDEFLYSIDPYHAAVFSFATKSFSVLADPGLAGRQLLTDKAASSLTDNVALLLADSTDRRALAFYDRGARRFLRTVAIPAGIEIEFDRKTDELLVAYSLSPSQSTLAAFDVNTGTFRHVGRYLRGFDVTRTTRVGTETVALARHKLSDAWLYTGTERRPLTSDGITYSAAMATNGDLLVSRPDDEGEISIWAKKAGAPIKRLTRGPRDVLPAFAPDGLRWAYVDYTKGAVMVCEHDDVCRVARKDDLLPSWPSFSPSGNELAYVTQAGGQRVEVISLSDGRVRDVGASFSQCPPVWGSSHHIWIFEGSVERYFWTERDAGTGAATGNRIAVPRAQNDANERRDQANCWPDASASRLFFPRVVIETEETSRLLRLDGPPHP